MFIRKGSCLPFQTGSSTGVVFDRYGDIIGEPFGEQMFMRFVNGIVRVDKSNDILYFLPDGRKLPLLRHMDESRRFSGWEID